MFEALAYLTYFALAVALIQVAVTDARTRRIPNGSLVVLGAIWLIQCVIEACTDGFLAAIEKTSSGLIASLLLGTATLLIAIAFEHLTGKHSVGGGDIKLIAVLGLFLGISGSLIALLVASLLGVMIAFVTRKRTMPFAPFIVSGVFISICLSANGAI